MKNSTVFIAFVTALALHIIIGVVLLMGMDFSLLKDKPKEEVVIINASILNQKTFDDLVQKKAQQKTDKLARAKRESDQKRAEKDRIKREKQIVEEAKKTAEAQRKKQEIERVEQQKEKIKQQKEKVKRIKAEKKLAQKEAADKLKAKKLKADKLKADKLKADKLKADKIKADKIKADKIKADKIKAGKLKADKIKADKLKADKLKAEKVRQQQMAEAERLRQAELDRQMEAEFADAFSDAQSSKELSEIARYKALIQDKISRNWQVEPSMKGKSCTLAIRLAPDGLVLSVNRSKGDQKLCDSAKRATLKSKTLPIPKDPGIAQQFRDFDITLEPYL